MCMRLWSRILDCSFEELIPLFSARYSGPPETMFGLETGNERLCIPRETTWCGDVVVYGAKNIAVQC